MKAYEFEGATTLNKERPPTPEERAGEILWLMLHNPRAVLREEITKQITAAVDGEREACLKIATEEYNRRYADDGARLGLDAVRDKIRARTPGPPHDEKAASGWYSAIQEGDPFP